MVQNWIRIAWYSCLLTVTSIAWSAEFKGQVMDKEGYGLPGAIVSLESGSETFSAVTGRQGAYTLEVAPGTYGVTVSFLGFQTIQQSITVPGEGLTQNFEMVVAQYEEMTVVSASKVETKLIDSPATISVLTAQDIENSAAEDFGGLMRTVPGVNVVQISARDINIVSRQASGSLSNSQLTLLDGRTIYEDFYGLVMWDFVPNDMSEIKQIEVIRGPASAVWGANAQTGVVNIITKTPREMLGTTLSLSAGLFGRDTDSASLDDGNSYGLNLTHAGLINSRMAYKVSVGYYEQDPLARPTGNVPIDPNRGTGGAPYPPFENKGTQQPKVDFRLDQELAGGARLIYGAGFAETEGIIHTGIGPFDIESGSRLSYGKVNYSKGALKINFFANLLDGDAQSLLTRGIDGRPITFLFENQTYDLEIGHSAYLGENNLLTYGGNIRRNTFDLSLAPLEDQRDEFGVYLQDEMTFDRFRFILGGRVDKFDNIDDPVFSPRFAAMYQPNDQHTIRASYNRAFRSPSMVENFLDIQFIVAAIDLGLIDPRLAGSIFPIISQARGNQDLKEDQIEAIELSYTGAVGNGLVSLSVYQNDTDENINFTNPPGAIYSSTNPPPGWPLPPEVLDLLLQQGIAFPSFFTYLNLGPLRHQGIEFSFDYNIRENWNLMLNYSWQDEPEILASDDPFPAGDLTLPPTNRYNIGVSYASRRFHGNASINHTDDAFWTDVLDASFHGATDDYTLLNLHLSYNWLNEAITASMKVNNATDEEVQQHIFGDITKRSITGEVRFKF